MDGIAEISGCPLKQPPGVAILSMTAAVDPIVEIRQSAPQLPVNEHDVGETQSDQLCIDGAVIKPKTRGKNI